MNILKDKIALIIVMTGLLVRIIAGALVPPGFDEAYYGVYTFNLAFGYFDHPPLVALTAGPGCWLSGSYSFLSLRLGAIVIFLFSAALMYQISYLLFKREAARISVVLLHLIPYFLVGMGAFVIPDNALGFFWLLFIYALVKMRLSSDDRWFLLAGFAAGGALLAKYHAVLLFAATAWLLIFDRRWHKYRKSPYLYAAFLLALLLFVPNILWNYQHDWISYAYQFGKGAGKMKLSFSWFIQGVSIQAGYLLPWHILILVWAIVKYLRDKRHESHILLPFAIIPVVIFTLIGFTRQILPHWPMPGYLAAIILAGGMMAGWKEKNIRMYTVVSGVITVLLVLVVIVQARTGFLPLKGKADVTLDGFGWDQLARHIRNEMPDKEERFFITHKWFTGGQLAYALRDEYVVTVFNEKAPHGFAFWTDQDHLLGKDAWFICTNRYRHDAQKHFRPFFDDIKQLPDFVAYRAGKAAKTFYIYHCENLHTKFEWPYGNDEAN